MDRNRQKKGLQKRIKQPTALSKVILTLRHYRTFILKRQRKENARLLFEWFGLFWLHGKHKKREEGRSSWTLRVGCCLNSYQTIVAAMPVRHHGNQVSGQTSHEFNKIKVRLLWTQTNFCVCVCVFVSQLRFFLRFVEVTKPQIGSFELKTELKKCCIYRISRRFSQNNKKLLVWKMSKKSPGDDLELEVWSGGEKLF